MIFKFWTKVGDLHFQNIFILYYFHVLE